MSLEFYNQLKESAQKNNLFMHYQGEAFSYKDLVLMIQKTTTLFRSKAIQKGDKIVIATYSDKLAIVLFLTCVLEGLCPVLLNPDTKQDRFHAIVDTAAPARLFIDSSVLLTLSINIPEKIIPVSAPQKSLSFINKLFKKTEENQAAFPAIINSLTPSEPCCLSESNDLAGLSFTSGTTGFSKGVMMTHQNLFSHLETLKQVFSYDEKSIVFNNLPIHHNDGLIQGPLITAYCGASLIRTEKFTIQKLESLLNELAAHQVTHFIAVPTIFELINRYTVHHDYFGYEAFKIAISTAAKLDQPLWEAFQQRFKVTLCNMYGLTETVAGGLFCGPSPDTFLIGTVGKPVDIQIKIIDEHGQPVGPHVPGELLVQGDSVSPGYFKNQDATTQALKLGWFYTGDLATQDDNGFVSIVGRKKDQIISGGYTIDPEEINEVVKRYPGVMGVVTLGMPDSILGEVPITVIESENPIDETVMMQFCRTHLEAEKQPKRLLSIPQFPRGAAGKVAISELKTWVDQTLNPKKDHPSHISETEILAIAAKVFQVSPELLSIEMRSTDIAGWDSLGHIKLILETESHYQIKFPVGDVVAIDSLKTLYKKTAQRTHV